MVVRSVGALGTCVSLAEHAGAPYGHWWCLLGLLCVGACGAGGRVDQWCQRGAAAGQWRGDGGGAEPGGLRSHPRSLPRADRRALKQHRPLWEHVQVLAP